MRNHRFIDHTTRAILFVCIRPVYACFPCDKLLQFGVCVSHVFVCSPCHVKEVVLKKNYLQVTIYNTYYISLNEV